MGKLTDRAVKSAPKGRHGDGDGLCLVVSRSNRRRWVFRYQMAGDRHDLGLGSYPAVSLAEARILAADIRKTISTGADPVIERKRSKKQKGSIPTFAEIAARVVAEQQKKSSNAKVRYQWERHLGPNYCGPLLFRQVHEITTQDIAGVLRTVWTSKPEVARKMYTAIRRVFEYAIVDLRDRYGVRLDHNPADWQYMRALGFEQPVTLSRGNHPSLPYAKMGEFMFELRKQDSVAAKALEFAILTAMRTGTVRLVRWSEIDFEEKIWIIPVQNLKDKRHRQEPFIVPLSERALEILAEMKLGSSAEFVFPGLKPNKPLSDMALLAVTKRMNKHSDRKWVGLRTERLITPHGFRASFRTWADERTKVRESLIEEAMGHLVGTAVERAYRRPQSMKERRLLMERWAKWCASVEQENVIFLSKMRA
jgi:integrase